MFKEGLPVPGVRGVAARGELAEGTATQAKPDQVDTGTGKFASP
jgi:hypothetical protein